MNNRIKSRYLRVVLLSLLFLLTAGQLSAKIIYFKNTANWSTVNAHMWGSSSKGETQWPGKTMTNVGDGWYSVETDDYTGIVFSNNGSNKTGDLDIPTDSKNAYDGGKWGIYENGNFSVYFLAGSFNGWSVDGTVMTNNDGVWSYTIEDAQVAEYKLKVTNGTWDSTWGYDNVDTDNSNVSFSTDNDRNVVFTTTEAGDITISFYAETKKITVTVPEPVVTHTVKIHGGLAIGSSNWDGNGRELTGNDGVYEYTFTKRSDNWNDYFVVTIDGKRIQETNESNNKEVVLNTTYTWKESTGNSAQFYIKDGILTNGNSYTVVINTNDKTIRINGNTAPVDDIPVYPRGVQSETELEAYDFESNPVVYLMSNMLNNNRISPEWQMISDGNGNYHLNGFAARTASDYKVRVYTSATSYVESASVSIDCNDGNASLAEGKLYNASVALNEGNYVLTLTEDENANGRMPFISLVGYAMKQDQEYKTPRAFEGHPSDVTTDKGWQEAWLQYDENGKIVKDRNGNVMYSTMWPPRNPIYFTANIGGERLYSSEQMTFKAQNNYEAKTGAEWKAELLAGENGEAYENLGNGEYKLQDNVEYVRYVVPDIWYVGSAKVWTGWNGEAYNNNGWKAMWSHHANWGYENKRATDEDGTDVVAEQPYYLSTDDNYNGNFKFDNPTYFKTIEFFYNTANRNESRLYTTLAFGKAQIEAKSHKEGDTYDYGQYRPSVDVPAGNTVKDYTIRCYDAATGELVTLNGGVVASGDGDPSKDFFQKEELGLAEGKYYFELEVTFQDGAGNTRKSVVKSNPFIIHFPGVYTLEPVALQLVKDGDAYVTYNKNTENAPLFRATINGNNELTAVAPVAESERTALFAKFESNTGFDWTDKVLVVAPVPAQFKLDAEKPNATLAITDYTLNTSLQVAKAEDGSMAYLDNTGKFTDKVYTAVMNYKETVEGEQTDKQSMAKPASALMMRPNPKTNGEVVVTVSQPVTIGSVSTIDGMAVPADAQYYTVSVEMPFGAANVTEDASAPKYIAVMGGLTAELSQAGTVTFNNVDPLTFVNDIKVTAVYPDGDNNYTLEANVGDPVSCNSETDGFKKYDLFTLSNFVPVFNNGLAGVWKLGFSKFSNVYDQIAEGNLAMQYLKTQAFLGEDKKEVLNTLVLEDKMTIIDYIKVDGHLQTALRFNVDGITITEGMSVSLKATPVYFVKVDESISVPGNGAAQAPALKADANEATYVALYGNEAVVEPTTDGIVTGVNDITVDGVKAYKVIENGQVIIVRGSERFNIMGQPVR